MRARLEKRCQISCNGDHDMPTLVADNPTRETAARPLRASGGRETPSSRNNAKASVAISESGGCLA